MNEHRAAVVGEWARKYKLALLEERSQVGARLRPLRRYCGGVRRVLDEGREFHFQVPRLFDSSPSAFSWKKAALINL